MYQQITKGSHLSKFFNKTLKKWKSALKKLLFLFIIFYYEKRNYRFLKIGG